jgi:PAS domain S-box-containing protein
MDLEQARAILDLAQSAFISMDEEGRITYWNIRAEETFGLSREQALGRPLAETVIPERMREDHRRGLAHFRASGEGPILNRRLELVAQRHSGEEFPVEMTVSALEEEEGGWSFHAFILDISERVANEQERSRRFDELQGELRVSEQRLAAIVDSLAEAVTIRGPDDRLVYAKRAALDRLGLSTLEQVVEADPRALMAGYETVGEDGLPIAMEDLPSVRLLRGEQPEPLTLRSVDRASGAEHWVLLKATAVRDSAGAIEAAVTISEDVTPAKRSAVRMEFLARAGQILASSLDYQETLRNVAGLVVPQIADWCSVDLLDEHGGRESVAVAHIDPAKLVMAERLRAYEPQALDPEQGLGLVWQTGEPVLYSDIPDELLVAAAVDEQHLQLLREVGMRAVLIVPMLVGGRTIGALTLVSAESARSFDRDDVEFAEQIAERAALAVENARLYRSRLEVARTLQDSLLPEALPSVPGWEIAALYRPAGHESEVGGDFYDLWQVGEDWLVMIGDVTGKGVAAATVTSLVRHTAWGASEVDLRPASILRRVDAALKRRPSLPVCTALCLQLSRGHGTVACGGHPPLLHVAGDGVHEVGLHGTLLGAFAKVDWPEQRFAIEPGETLVAFTDGVTDAVGPGDERFGLDRLKGVVEAGREGPPGAMRERLLDALAGFQVGEQADDTAVVIMRFSGVVGRSESVAHKVGVSAGRELR